MKIVLNSLNLALPGLPFQWLYIFFGGQQLKNTCIGYQVLDLNIGVLTRIWKSLYAQNYPRNSFELKIGLAHKSSAQECYESLFVEAYLPILRLTFSFLQNEAKLRRSECLSSIIATLISYCNPIKLLHHITIQLQKQNLWILPIQYFFWDFKFGSCTCILYPLDLNLRFHILRLRTQNS